MKHLARRRLDRGAAAVELALVLPILLVLVFGIVDFARAYNQQQAVTASAREGVRVLALTGSQADAVARAKAAGVPIPAGELAVTSGACDPRSAPGNPVHVTVTHTFTFLTPLPALTGGLVPGSLTLKGEGEMRCGG